MLTVFVTLATDSAFGIKTRPLVTVNAASTDNKSTALELPEITHYSDAISNTIVYSEPKTVSQDALIIDRANGNVTDKSTQIQVTDEANKETLSAQDNLPKVAVSLPVIESKLLVKPSETVQLTHKTQKQTTAVAISEQVIDKKQLTALPLPAAERNEIIANKATQSKMIVVKKGDTLSAIFKRHSLSSSTLYKIINSGKEAKRLTRIKPGQQFDITLNSNNEIESLHFALNKVDTLVVNKTDEQFVSHIDSNEVEIKQQFASETISNSLFSAGQKAGLSDSMTMKLAQIFGWDIDFALDIRKGDAFTILFEEKYIDGKKFADGNILSAEFVNQGKVFQAIRYTDSSGHTDFYSEKGLSMRKAFLRTPVEFSRISSRFSSGRKHPVLNRIRAHKGVDYAASRGTPIKAVGDGKVIFKGRKGGYGRVVILQHGSKYTTLYAHMNSYNKKIKHGSRVKQGQTIGYIGSSGLATGPHLHYEFRVNGVHRNPLTVPLPSAAPIAKKYRSDFQSAADTLISQLKLRRQQTVALKDE